MYAFGAFSEHVSGERLEEIPTRLTASNSELSCGKAVIANKAHIFTVQANRVSVKTKVYDSS